MSSHKVLVVSLIALGLFLVFYLLCEAPPASAQEARIEGSYRVVANDKAFVLYDCNDKGKSWILFPANAAKRHAWIPIKLLETESQIQSWQMLQNARD